MKVVTNIKKRDLIRLNFEILPKLRSTYITIICIALFAFGFICWKSGIPHTLERWIVASSASLVGGIFGTFLGFLMNLFPIIFASTKDNGVLGLHEYTLTPEGLHESTSANEGLSKWEGISKVKVSGQYLLFQISSYLFHIVPKRSFSSNEEFNKFVSIATESWKNAHNKSNQ